LEGQRGGGAAVGAFNKEFDLLIGEFKAEAGEDLPFIGRKGKEGKEAVV
jgi:hypothetical protein